MHTPPPPPNCRSTYSPGRLLIFLLSLKTFLHLISFNFATVAGSYRTYCLDMLIVVEVENRSVRRTRYINYGNTTHMKYCTRHDFSDQSKNELTACATRASCII